MTDGATWVNQALREHAEHSGSAISRPKAPASEREQQVLDRIDRARKRRPKVREERITMSHGSGGKATHTLIEAVFLEAFGNPALNRKTVSRHSRSEIFGLATRMGAGFL